MQSKFVEDVKLYAALAQQAPVRVRRTELVRDFLPWAASLKPGRSTVADQRIWIVFEAKRFLDSVVKRGMRVFEYGAGGSTLYFLSKGCELVSVEHHPQWHQTVVDETARRGYSRWRGLLHEPDPEPWRPQEGEDVAGGYASEFGEYVGRTFKNYASAIKTFPDRSFDIVLVDGRARASCIFHARDKVKDGGWLVLDNSERPRYRKHFGLLDPERWRIRDFFGPGPYVKHEFWGTTAWNKLKS